jgi:transcriptional regulator with XRE-family HTH domain
MSATVFGARLRACRRERDMSQDELAQKMGTSKQVISRYEIGMRVPKITVASEFARILGVPVDYLLGNTDDRRVPEEFGDIRGVRRYDEIVAIERAALRMSDVERRRMLNMVRAAFDYAFDKY